MAPLAKKKSFWEKRKKNHILWKKYDFGGGGNVMFRKYIPLWIFNFIIYLIYFLLAMKFILYCKWTFYEH